MPTARSVLPATMIVLSACATTQAPKSPKEDPGRNITMDTMKIQVNPDPLVGLENYDAGDLLERGNELFDAKDYDKALKVYDRLITEFPQSSLLPTALYNTGLSLERLAEHSAAAERYERVIADYPNATTAKDSYYRLGQCYSKLEKWGEVEKAFWAVRQRNGLSPMDEIEARVGTGVALFMQKEYATAEREFLQALRFYREHEKREYLPATYWIAQSRFYIGEIAARQFEAVELESTAADPDKWKDDMTARLEEKCELLLRAQNNFIRAIREGHTGWATASGFRIGSLYEGLYEAMVDVPVPPSVDDEEAKDFYRKEVKLRISVLVKKAINVYERSLDMAQRVGESNEWVDRTEKALERMKKLALDSMS